MQFKLMGRNKLRQAKKQSQVSGPIFSTARGLGVCLILRSYEGRFSESFAFFRCSKVVESMRYFRMASRSAGYVRTRGPESLKKRHLCSDGPASNSDMVALLKSSVGCGILLLAVFSVSARPTAPESSLRKRTARTSAPVGALVVNQTPANGQFSSVSAAVAALPDDGSAQTIFIEAGMSSPARFTY